MSRAHAVAVGDGREPLNVSSEQPREHLGFGLTHLREFFGHVRDWAVVLADLSAGSVGADGRRETVFAERFGQHLWALGRISHFEQGAVTVFQIKQPMLRERLDSIFADGVGQEPQGACRKFVVGVVEVVTTSIGDDKCFRRAAAATLSGDALVARFYDTVCQQLV